MRRPRLDEIKRATYPSIMANATAEPGGARRTIERGRYYEDFQVGDVYRHHWGRTLEAAESQLFATATMNTAPLYFNKLHAQPLGHAQLPIPPLLWINDLFAIT